MQCERCGGMLAHVGSIPLVAACTGCGKQRAGQDGRTVPQCPVCFGDLIVVPGILPIALSCSRCPAGASVYRPDFERGLLHPMQGLPTQSPAACPQCGGGLTVFEDLPPRAECPRCDIDLSLEPIRPTPQCPLCGDQVRIVGGGAMPPQGECVACGEVELLADAPEPFAPPVEITVTAGQLAPVLAQVRSLQRPASSGATVVLVAVVSVALVVAALVLLV